MTPVDREETRPVTPLFTARGNIFSPPIFTFILANGTRDRARARAHDRRLLNHQTQSTIGIAARARIINIYSTVVLFIRAYSQYIIFALLFILQSTQRPSLMGTRTPPRKTFLIRSTGRGAIAPARACEYELFILQVITNRLYVRIGITA